MNPAVMLDTARPFFVLAGPTAAGKTEVAHVLARQEGWALLSADAMLVYRGMDIGTAKPSISERADLLYGGVDLVTPDQPFSVGAYLAHVRAFLNALPEGHPVLVVGGTGLYIKAIVCGLDPIPPVDPAVRDQVARLYAVEGLEGISRACIEADPARYTALADKSNPRRVMRALELARMGIPYEPTWSSRAPANIPLVRLDIPRDVLATRIQARIDGMFQCGLLDEVAGLLRRYPYWSNTARQAIGYREAVTVLQGGLSEADARAAIFRRTRRYARRQETWFRHQLPFCAVQPSPKDSVMDSAGRILSAWRRDGASDTGN